MFIKAIMSSKMLDLHLSVLRWRCYGLIFSVSLLGEFVKLALMALFSQKCFLTMNLIYICYA